MLFFVPQVRSELLLWGIKLFKFIDEARVLGQALRGSAWTIGVFLFFVFLLQVVLGYNIFVIESAMHYCLPPSLRPWRAAFTGPSSP